MDIQQMASSPPILTRQTTVMWAVCSIDDCCLHQDAHEFLSQCLDQLKDDVEKMNKGWTNEAAASLSSSVTADNGHEVTTPSPPSKAEPGEEADTSRIYTCPVAVNMEFEVQHTISCKR